METAARPALSFMCPSEMIKHEVAVLVLRVFLSEGNQEC